MTLHIPDYTIFIDLFILYIVIGFIYACVEIIFDCILSNTYNYHMPIYNLFLWPFRLVYVCSVVLKTTVKFIFEFFYILFLLYKRITFKLTKGKK